MKYSPTGYIRREGANNTPEYQSVPSSLLNKLINIGMLTLIISTPVLTLYAISQDSKKPQRTQESALVTNITDTVKK